MRIETSAGNRKVAVALWLLVAVLGALTVKQALAACADPYCGDYTIEPNCSAYGCSPPIVPGPPSSCCCTNGVSGCCQYTCERRYCYISTPNCPDGVKAYNGVRRVDYGPCHEPSGQCGGPQ